MPLLHLIDTGPAAPEILTSGFEEGSAAPEILTSGFEEGSGPIFLDQLQCSESDKSLLHCAMGRTIGLHHCNHSMDVSIKCSGNEHSSPEL